MSRAGRAARRLADAGLALWHVVDRLTPLIGIAIVVVAFAVLKAENSKTNETATTAAGTATHQAIQQAELRAVQSYLLRSNKEQLASRVTTVTQRCDFTALVTEELVKRAPAIDAGPFKKSYLGCREQLAGLRAKLKVTPTAPASSGLTADPFLQP
jgi:hypothetical protein